MNAAGRFITLEGGEGVGKTTQIRALVSALEARGLKVVISREPGGSTGAETIRRLLLTGEADRWDPPAEALLFAAARSDHVARTIRPALASGSWVVCDRFIDSSRAYQSGASGLADADILDLHRVGSGGLLPDRTLILDLSTEEAAARAAARDVEGADRIGGRDADFHARVRHSFRTIAAQEPERCRLVDAGGAAEAVTQRLIAALADLLP